MGYKTPEELYLLKDSKNKKESKVKIDNILKEIKDDFGWTLNTGHAMLDYNKTEMKLEYKEPKNKTDKYKKFCEEDTKFLERTRTAKVEEKSIKRQQPGTTLSLKGLGLKLGLKKVKTDDSMGK